MNRRAKLTDGTIVTVLAVGFIGSIKSSDGAVPCFIIEHPDGHTDWMEAVTFLSDDELRNLWEAGDITFNRDSQIERDFNALSEVSITDVQKGTKLYEFMRMSFMAGSILSYQPYILSEAQLENEFEAYLKTILANDTPSSEKIIPS